MSGAETQRLDQWLWCARFASRRAACAAIAGSGLVRINRQPTGKSHARVRVGDVLTVPLHDAVRVVRVIGLASRRGPPDVACGLYVEFAEGGEVCAPR